MTATTVARVTGRDLVALCKPRITTMVTATGIAGAIAAPHRSSAMFPALIGTALIVAGANVMNQWLERDTDARMERTHDRPLASGRISPAVGLAFGLALSFAAAPFLLVDRNVALLGAIAWLAYVVLYTPMKRHTRWALPVGAVAGAMPPAMGWIAAGGDARGAWYLFGLLFLWQLPHFIAIASFRASEYAAAGLRVETRGLVLSAAVFVLWTCLSPIGGRAVGAVTGALFLAVCVRRPPREVFAFTMGHLAVLLVSYGVLR